jgi:hypothetical protein
MVTSATSVVLQTLTVIMGVEANPREVQTRLKVHLVLDTLEKYTQS